MGGRSVTIEVPEYLYDRLKRRAEEARLSIEAELVQTLASTVPPDDRLELDLEDTLASLALLDDEALWHLARRRFPQRSARRLQSLHSKLQREGLTEEERQLEARLVDEYERAMLIRAQAAVLLKQRGHDIAPLVPRA
jgi:hypothetical protein